LHTILENDSDYAASEQAIDVLDEQPRTLSFDAVK
jgi:hypothetical protein